MIVPRHGDPICRLPRGTPVEALAVRLRTQVQRGTLGRRSPAAARRLRSSLGELLRRARPGPASASELPDAEWLTPPDNVIPATVALDVILVQRRDLAIWVADA